MKREALICTIIKNIPPDADIKTYAIMSENPRTPEGCASMDSGLDGTKEDVYNFTEHCIRGFSDAVGEAQSEVLLNVAYGLKGREVEEQRKEGDDGQDED